MSAKDKQQLGKYEILEPLGHGAHATVYKARDTTLDRIVALKVMRPGLLWDPDAVERFLREARAAAQLEHPHIVTIYEVGEAEGTYFIAMRYLPGATVDALIQQGPLPIEQAVDITRQVAEALGHGHERGFIHRDVKPGNIIVSDNGFATLTDFGLVKALTWASLTSSGGAMGTPGYVAPEIWEETGATPATDVYALGVVLWEMLAGQRLFAGETPAGVMHKHLTMTPPPLTETRPDVPPTVAKVVARALAKTPKERYPGGDALAQALQEAVKKEAEKPEPAQGAVPPQEDLIEERNTPEVAVQAANWSLWFWWILGSTVGAAVGTAASHLIPALSWTWGWSGWAEGSVWATAAWSAIGISQWLVLRRHIKKAGWWVLGSAVGGAMGFALGSSAATTVIDIIGSRQLTIAYSLLGYVAVDVSGSVADTATRAVSWVVSGGVFGTVIGIGQWLVLRRHIKRAGWWVLGSAVSGVVGLIAIASGIVVVGLTWPETVVMLPLSSAGAMLYGSITGLVLGWLLSAEA